MRIAAFLLAAFAQVAMAWQLPQPDPESQAYRVGGGVSSPSVLARTEVVRTDEARAEYIYGFALLKLVVSADGAPRDIVVIKGLGYGLDQAAVECVRHWKFKPGLKNGVAVDVIATVEVNFPPDAKLVTQDTGLHAPVLLSPSNGQIFNKDHLSVTLDWQPSAYAVAWVVERDFAINEKWRGDSYTLPGLLRFTKIPSLTFEEQPGVDKERWRVWPLNQKHERGVPSEWRTLQFVQ